MFIVNRIIQMINNTELKYEIYVSLDTALHSI